MERRRDVRKARRKGDEQRGNRRKTNRERDVGQLEYDINRSQILRRCEVIKAMPSPLLNFCRTTFTFSAPWSFLPRSFLHHLHQRLTASSRLIGGGRETRGGVPLRLPKRPSCQRRCVWCTGETHVLLPRHGWHELNRRFLNEDNEQ